MKPTIGIMGFPKTITIAKKVVKEFEDRIHFNFITSILDDSISVIRQYEREGLDIIIAGPGNSYLLRKHLSIPIVSFFATTRTIIMAIKKARKFSHNIAMVLSENEQYDYAFFEELLNVELTPYFCKYIADYNEACAQIKLKGFKVIIGGSYAVDAAKSIGIKGVFPFYKREIFRKAIERAIELVEFNGLQMEKISQMNILLQESNEALFILDSKNRITFLNKAVEDKLNIPKPSAIGQEFHNFFTGLPLKQYLYHKPGEVIAQRGEHNVVLNFHLVMVKDHSKGKVVVARLVSEIEEVEKRIRKKIHKKGFDIKYTFNDITGNDPKILSCIQKSKAYAHSESPILIFGETGTGKEMFAQAIHHHSSRREYPFVAINCATLPSELIESELFGYEKGAFSGARSRGKVGLVEFSHHGTLFLDEISSLAYSLQAKLLRLLQEKEFIRVGGENVVPVDVRILSATNTDLIEAIKKGDFRKDLYYRLNALFLKLPPLRERKMDILPLFLLFLSQSKPEMVNALRKNIALLQNKLDKLPFPGNIRELQNLVERFAILTTPQDLYQKKYLIKILEECYEDERSYFTQDGLAEPHIKIPLKGYLKSSLKEAEQAIIRHHINDHTKIKDMAEQLGIERSTLWRKLKKYEINIFEKDKKA